MCAYVFYSQSKNAVAKNPATADAGAPTNVSAEPRAIAAPADVAVGGVQSTMGGTMGGAGGADRRARFEETYQLGKELGHGSFSTVREGVHKVTNLFSR